VRWSWIIGALAVIAAVVVVAVLAIRLTSDSDDSDDLEAWAGSVCTSVADWRTSIVELVDAGGSLSVETLRERVDDAEAATEDLLSEVRDLGEPDVESGDELQAELDATVESLQTEYEALKADAEDAFEADSPTELLQELASLAPGFQALLNDAATLLEDLESAPDVAEETRDELSAAFESADSCRELRDAD